MNTPIAMVLAKLGDDAKPSGSGWLCHCPAHDDNRASLSVSEGDDGRVLLHCFAGCTPNQIVSAIGLTLSDLFAATEPAHPTPKAAKSAKTTAAGGKPAKTFPTADAAVAWLTKRSGTPAGCWTYTDATGTPMMVVVRFDRADGSKFFQPVGRFSNEWRVKAMPGTRPLYALPTLLSADIVFVVEGEKCADALHKFGFVATTSAGGASAAKQSNWAPLVGKTVMILPDNDDPGRRYAKHVTGILTKLNPAAVVKVVRLPGLPDKGDIVDWLHARRDTSKEKLKAELTALIAATEPLKAATPAPAHRSATVVPKVVCLSDVTPEEVLWLWRGRIALGKLTLLVGRPKEGKSLLTCFMAAVVSTGREWPCGEHAPLGDILFISAEDDPADTIRPRLDAAGAECWRIKQLQAAVVIEADGTKREVAFTLQNLELIQQTLDDMPDCKLVVIDPIGSYLGAGVDAHRDNEVRTVLAPLAALAAERGVAVLIVCHNRKADAAFADDTTLGSRGFVGIARSVLHLRTDPDDPEKQRRVLAAGGTNNAAPAAALAFRIVGDPPRLEWEAEPLEGLHADDLMKPPTDRPRGPQPKKRTAAADWLAELLRNGPKPVGEIKEQATAAELSWRTVKRAQEELGITPHKQGYAGGWVWHLPAEGGQPELRRVPRGEQPGTLRENQGETPPPEPEKLEGCQADDNLAPFAERGEELPTSATPSALSPAPSAEIGSAEPADVWNDLDEYATLLRRTGRVWGDEVRWLNAEHDARLSKDPPFFMVPAELRRLSAEHLGRLPVIPHRSTL